MLERQQLVVRDQHARMLWNRDESSRLQPVDLSMDALQVGAYDSEQIATSLRGSCNLNLKLARLHIPFHQRPVGVEFQHDAGAPACQSCAHGMSADDIAWQQAF